MSNNRLTLILLLSMYPNEATIIMSDNLMKTYTEEEQLSLLLQILRVIHSKKIEEQGGRLSYTKEEIREGLKKIELPSSYKDMRKMYDENPKFHHISFEEFVKRVRVIKTIIDNAKLRYKVR